MSRQFQNFTGYFENTTLKFVSILEEFINDHKVRFKCQKGHISELTSDSFKNKRCRIKRPEELCTQCQETNIKINDNKLDIVNAIDEKFELEKKRYLKKAVIYY